MRTAFENLRETLAALRLYRLHPGSLVERELKSYQAGFELVETALQRLEASAFIQTCDAQMLTQWERLLELPSWLGVPMENRREIVLNKLAVSPVDSNMQGMLRSLRAVGLCTQIQEDPPLGELLLHGGVITGGYDSLDSLKRRVYAMLPAHLEAAFDIGALTWADFDAKDLSCDQLDIRDFTWEWFDINGEKL